jgi:hypothetical protein
MQKQHKVSFMQTVMLTDSEKTRCSQLELVGLRMHSAKPHTDVAARINSGQCLVWNANASGDKCCPSSSHMGSRKEMCDTQISRQCSK